MRTSKRGPGMALRRGAVEVGMKRSHHLTPILEIAPHRSGQSLVPAGCLEERFGVRLAPANFVWDVLDSRPQAWIASQGSRADKTLWREAVYGPQSVRVRSASCQLPRQVELDCRIRCRPQCKCLPDGLDAPGMVRRMGSAPSRSRLTSGRSFAF